MENPWEGEMIVIVFCSTICQRQLNFGNKAQLSTEAEPHDAEILFCISTEWIAVQLMLNCENFYTEFIIQWAKMLHLGDPVTMWKQQCICLCVGFLSDFTKRTDHLLTCQINLSPTHAQTFFLLHYINKKNHQRHTIKLVFYLQPPIRSVPSSKKRKSIVMSSYCDCSERFSEKRGAVPEGRKKCEDPKRENLYCTLQKKKKKSHEVSGYVLFH